MPFIDYVIAGVIIYILYRLIRWQRTQQTRYIPFEVKRAVLKRYFSMCAVCPEANLLEFHHKKKHADGGDNSEMNVAPLCPKHHAMVTRNG